ncbi:134_t:CDS:2 [Paraglomus brasilianum]|uniref:134_t:CDS:1 n=1 Tax=Paraglomus brasilianum TaxID=144538 RepID=A0A9N9B958_9GLOM|nr:134_t:CDS:2 [Paraglomus brasilianum]
MPPKVKNKQHSKRKESSHSKDTRTFTWNGTNATKPPSWPKLIYKPDLTLSMLLEDQITVIDNFFSKKECMSFIHFVEQHVPLELANPNGIPKKGEAYRDNDRFSIDDAGFADILYQKTGLKDLVSQWKPKTRSKTVTVSKLNSNIRIYRYRVGQKFGVHYDDSVRDTVGMTSEWTLLIYLNGEVDQENDDDVNIPQLVGGETVFYKPKNRGEVIVKPRAGMALFHRHGIDCLLHEAKEVKAGVKYVLRSDLMFG